MKNFDENLEKYAELIVKVGLNLKKGDNLQIGFNIWGLDLARKVAEKAYEVGVKDVVLNFNDEKITRSFLEKADDVSDYPKFKADYMEQLSEHKYHRLAIIAADPSNLKGIDPERIAASSKAAGMALKKVQEMSMQNFVKWCVIAVPNPAWAAKVFPKKDAKDAMDSLWENIFMATRVDQKDPVAAWQEHDANLKKHQDYLNEARFEKLLYEGPGTDLEVYLTEGHNWVGGSGESQDGDKFMANIPTEEVFTMPHRTRVNGKLKATMPLAVRGSLIEDFSFVFKDGKIVEFEAKEGKDIFEGLINTDEGARYLGEVALVAHNSPISNTGILFQNTLFDENASCHFAVGQAYSENIENGEKLSSEEMKEKGMNESMIHVDFMIGSDKLKVTGVKKDGTQVVLLDKGDWQI